MRHQFAELPGLRTHVAEAGDGEPVLLLHGFPQHWWQWRHVLPALSRDYRAICPDLRGAGWTDAPRAGYTREQMLADVVALLDALGLDRVHLLTHDVGSLIGYQLCLRHPERVRTHLALSIPPPFFAFDVRFVLAMARYAAFDFAMPVPVLAPLLLGRGRQRLPQHMLRAHAGEGTFTVEDVELFVAQFREPARARAGSALYRHLVLPEAVRIMAGAYRGTRLRTPTHVLIGAEDRNMRLELLHGYAEHVDDTAVEVVDGAAHFVADDAPAVVVERARELFARTTGADASP